MKQVQESAQVRNSNCEGKKHEARKGSDSVSGYIANVNLDGLSVEQKNSVMFQEESESFSRDGEIGDI